MRPGRLLAAAFLAFFPIAAASAVAGGGASAGPASSGGAASSGPGFTGRDLVTFENIPSPNFGIVNAILRDHRGFLWFGTGRGLCKYDGYRARVFNDEAAAGEPVPVVLSMLLRDSGSVLLGTSRGLLTFNLITEKFAPFGPEGGLPGERIPVLARDPDGTIWVGTETRGLLGIDPLTGAVKYHLTGEMLGDVRISALLPAESGPDTGAGSSEESGNIWVGTMNAGLVHAMTSGHILARYRSSPADKRSLWTDRVTALARKETGDLLVGTTEGLNELETASGRLRRIRLPSPTPHTIRLIVADPTGARNGAEEAYWIAAADLGLLRYAGGTVKLFSLPQDAGRTFTAVRTVYPDPVASSGPELLLWIGTRHGVDKVLIARNPFLNRIRGEDGFQLGRGAVLCVLEDAKGMVWAGLWGGGLDEFRREDGTLKRAATFLHSSTDPGSLPHNDVNTLFEDRGGRLWVGTHGGLAELSPDRSRMRVYRHDPRDSGSIVPGAITEIHEDRTGRLWVATSAGLSRRAPGDERFENFLHRPEEAHAYGRNEVSHILEDARSNIWVSTYGKGLLRFAPDGTVVVFRHPPDSSGKMENFVYNLVADNQDKFWLSTAVGLVSFDPSTGEYRRHALGELPFIHISGIEPDRRGNLWLATGIGLMRYTPGTGTVVRFDEKQGIPFREFFGRFFRTAGGTLIAGGLDGITEFDPELVTASSRVPEVAITAIRIFDRELQVPAGSGSRLELAHDQNFFSFTFAALDYRNPSQNRFAYKMEGIDPDWIDAGTRNVTSYAHLDPGDYVFRVKACNSENVWNEAGTSVAFTIARAWWQTWWFRSLAAAFLVGVGYSAYSYRMKRIVEMERLRLRIADDLHDDVGSNLGAIAIVSRSLGNTPDVPGSLKEKLSQIYEIAVHTSEGMRDIVWAINPKDDTLGDLLLKMKETAASQLRDLPYSFEAPRTHDAASVAIEFKRNVYLAFKEIVNNVVKHSRASKVDIGVAIRDGTFELTVADDGVGFESTREFSGNGLPSLRKRAEALGGTCERRSAVGSGTTVRFSVKMNHH